MQTHPTSKRPSVPAVIVAQNSYHVQVTVIKPSRRHLLSIGGLPFLFLPWRGCTQGGFYDTGVTDNCQKIYQPAFAAEERLKQRLSSESAKNSEESFANEDAVDNALNKGESVHELVPTPSQQRALMDVERQRSTRAFTDRMWQTLE